MTRLETLILESMSCQRWLNAVSRSSTISSCRLLRLISSTATSRSSSTCDVSRLRSVTSFYTRTQLSINQSTSITLLSCSEKNTRVPPTVFLGGSVNVSRAPRHVLHFPCKTGSADSLSVNFLTDQQKLRNKWQGFL